MASGLQSSRRPHGRRIRKTCVFYSTAGHGTVKGQPPLLAGFNFKRHHRLTFGESRLMLSPATFQRPSRFNHVTKCFPVLVLGFPDSSLTDTTKVPIS